VKILLVAVLSGVVGGLLAGYAMLRYIMPKSMTKLFMALNLAWLETCKECLSEMDVGDGGEELEPDSEHDLIMHIPDDTILDWKGTVQ
jgi:hypothetical protein